MKLAFDYHEYTSAIRHDWWSKGMYANTGLPGRVPVGVRTWLAVRNTLGRLFQ